MNTIVQPGLAACFPPRHARARDRSVEQPSRATSNTEHALSGA